MFFASFLAISINYSKAFNVKNNVVDLVSKYEGNNCNARNKISEYLRTTGYLVAGNCDLGYKGYDLKGNPVYSGKSYYCIKTESTGTDTSIEKKYYRIEIFFKVDLPILGNITSLNIKGDTEYIFYAFDQENNNCSGG